MKTLSPTPVLQTIVLARVEMTGRRDTGEFERHNGNWYPKYVDCERAVALVWLNEGGVADIRRASEHADREGYTVLLYTTTEKDPLGKARKAILH